MGFLTDILDWAADTVQTFTGEKERRENVAQIKKTYESNELLKDIEQTIEFYEKHFVAKSDKSETTIEYDKLYKVIENKTNFYLMIADNQGYIVSKANCSEELIDFIIALKKK